MTQSTLSLRNFLSSDTSEIKRILLHCCFCKMWAEKVVMALSTVDSPKSLRNLLISCWSTTEEAGYLEAFAAHPQIGDIEVLRDKYATQAHAEQGQVAEADNMVLESLMRQNQAYVDKFGFIFIICATGKSAEEMLSSLNTRLKNDRATEISNAAKEQEKIMLLRLSQIIEDF